MPVPFKPSTVVCTIFLTSLSTKSITDVIFHKLNKSVLTKRWSESTETSRTYIKKLNNINNNNINKKSQNMNKQGWQTTTSYTFRPPKHVPGYTGYIPQQRYGYGDTFANMTEQSFHAQRNHTLFSSTNQSEKEFTSGEKAFPTVYSNNPALVLADRKRCRERWLAHQKYTRSTEGTREENHNNFLKSCQKHRHHYTDQTGTIQRVDIFLLPKLSIDIPINNKSQNTMKEERLFLPQTHQHHHANNNHSNNNTDFRGNYRDRAVRDQFFENR